MSDPLFLVDRVPPVGGFRLDGAEGHHAAVVARLRTGESVVLGDGRGGVATAAVDQVGRGTVDLTVTGVRTVPAADPRLVVVQGIAKGDRGELAVQAMTEVGVDEIVPWAAARSVVQWRGERGERALARWRSTAREAAKQSRRAWIPEVAEQASTAAVAARLPGADGRPGAALVLHEEATDRLTAVDLPAVGEICLVVGPEGGIDDGELDRFVRAGAVAVRLGESVLRTSTAGVAAISVLSARLGRW